MTDDERRTGEAAAAARRPAATPRRRHAAAGGRIMALGLSAGAAVVFTAAMANTVSPTEPAPAADPPAPLVVRVVLAGGTTVDTPLAPAPVVTAAPATAKASARSRAS